MSKRVHVSRTILLTTFGALALVLLIWGISSMNQEPEQATGLSPAGVDERAAGERLEDAAGETAAQLEAARLALAAQVAELELELAQLREEAQRRIDVLELNLQLSGMRARLIEMRFALGRPAFGSANEVASELDEMRDEVAALAVARSGKTSDFLLGLVSDLELLAEEVRAGGPTALDQLDAILADLESRITAEPV